MIPWAPLAGVMATVSVFAVAQGLSYPLLSFIWSGRVIRPLPSAFRLPCCRSV
jgi:hypothetical protein